jgi:hypothetical protein
MTLNHVILFEVYSEILSVPSHDRAVSNVDFINLIGPHRRSVSASEPHMCNLIPILPNQLAPTVSHIAVFDTL